VKVATTIVLTGLCLFACIVGADGGKAAEGQGWIKVAVVSDAASRTFSDLLTVELSSRDGIAMLLRPGWQNRRLRA
jgi:hypothetical protein